MVVPKTVISYDHKCQITQRHVELEVRQVNVVATCGNNAECAGQLAFYGLVATSSAVVSGSVAVIGNVVYWLEKQGQCVRGQDQPAPAVVPSPQPSPKTLASAAKA
jgi:hypothetical protein